METTSAPGHNPIIPKVEVPVKKKKGKRGKGGGPATLYRVTMRNQLRSISIADQKANILIGISLILISIIIGVLGMGTNVAGLRFLAMIDIHVPFYILLITCLAAAVLAFLAVRPVRKPWKADLKNKLFFRDYEEETLEDFLGFMDEIVGSPEQINTSLNTDMYLFGRTIIRKYRLLRLAYLIFLVGLITTVVVFIILKLIP